MDKIHLIGHSGPEYMANREFRVGVNMCSYRFILEPFRVLQVVVPVDAIVKT